jgi:hypothetical protein
LKGAPVGPTVFLATRASWTCAWKERNFDGVTVALNRNRLSQYRSSRFSLKPRPSKPSIRSRNSARTATTGGAVCWANDVVGGLSAAPDRQSRTANADRSVMTLLGRTGMNGRHGRRMEQQCRQGTGSGAAYSRSKRRSVRKYQQILPTAGARRQWRRTFRCGATLMWVGPRRAAVEACPRVRSRRRADRCRPTAMAAAVGKLQICRLIDLELQERLSDPYCLNGIVRVSSMT